jgi:VanZ family protein
MTLFLRLAFWAAFLFAFVMAVLPHPPQVPGDPPDKILHIIAFAVLAALAAPAYPRTRMLWLLAGLSAFGAVIEIVQTIPSLYRDGDVVDWLADTASAATVLALVALIRAGAQRVRR